MSNNNNSEHISVWEQHGQTIITSIILALLLWVGYNVNENAKHSAVTIVHINSLQRQIEELKEVVDNDVNRIGAEQSSRGPRISANERNIQDLYQLLRRHIDLDHDHNGDKK